MSVVLLKGKFVTMKGPNGTKGGKIERLTRILCIIVKFLSQRRRMWNDRESDT